MTELLDRALAKPSKRIAKLKTLSASESRCVSEALEEDRLNRARLFGANKELPNRRLRRLTFE